MFYIVVYDIIDDRRRNRLAKLLQDFGSRVQYSVFECSMGATELKLMEGRIEKTIAGNEDSVRIYSLCRECERKTITIGTGTNTEDPDVFII